MAGIWLCQEVSTQYPVFIFFTNVRRLHLSLGEMNPIPLLV